MKIICIKENLKKGLAVVSRVVGNNNPLQVLNNILIKTEAGRIKLSSTNLEIGINTWVGGKVEEEGELTIPARIISEYINNLPTDKVTLQTKETTLIVEADNYHTSIKGLSADDFPLIPQVEEGWSAKIDSLELRNVFSESLWATSTNETQPEISGLYMAFEDNNLRVAATDRYRLAERTAVLKESVKLKKEVIIPFRTASEIYKILGLNEGVVEVFFSETQVLFRFDGTELVSRLIDGQYPDYQQIIPKEYQTQAEVDKEEFTHALKATSLFAPDTNNINIEIKDGVLVVTASSVSAGENTTQISATVSGGDNGAVFNYRYLLDCLQALKEPRVILKMISDSSPALIVPKDRTNYLYIVMPIKS